MDFQGLQALPHLTLMLMARPVTTSTSNSKVRTRPCVHIRLASFYHSNLLPTHSHKYLTKILKHLHRTYRSWSLYFYIYLYIYRRWQQFASENYYWEAQGCCEEAIYQLRQYFQLANVRREGHYQPRDGRCKWSPRRQEPEVAVSKEERTRRRREQWMWGAKLIPEE